MASFQAKIRWKWPRKKQKYEIIVSFRSYPMHNRKFQTNSQKITKYYYGFISSQNEGGNTEKVRK